MRTTIDIDDPLLKELKRLQKAKGKPLGRLVSDLLAQAIHAQRGSSGKPSPAAWVSKDMGARLDLMDKEALHAAMDRPPPSPGRKRGP